MNPRPSNHTTGWSSKRFDIIPALALVALTAACLSQFTDDAGSGRRDQPTRTTGAASPASQATTSRPVLTDALRFDAEPTSGIPVRVEGYQSITLGLDGRLYEAYRPEIIAALQDRLRLRGLYAGPTNGVLDSPTMNAICRFQAASLGLEPSGIPTPRTRRLLVNGSHT